MRPQHSRLESERLTPWVREAAEWALTRGCRGQGQGDAWDRGPGASPCAVITEGRLVLLEEEAPRDPVLLTAVRSP